MTTENTNANFLRVKNKIEVSSISAEDKKFLLDIFAEVNDECLADIVELFEQKGDWVEKFNENRKAKQTAVANQDMKAWQTILDQEKKYVEELTFGLD